MGKITPCLAVPETIKITVGVPKTVFSFPNLPVDHSQQQSQNRVTLRDVAHALGVSHVTVSLALRNSSKIPVARRRQVQEKAAEMGYQPNAMAAALAHLKSSSTVVPVQAAIGWLNTWPDPDKLRSFAEFDRYWIGATGAAAKFGYHVEEFVCPNDRSLNRLQRTFRTRNIKGILLPPQPTSNLGKFAWEEFSAVRFGRSVTNPRLHIVGSDQVGNSILAVKEILKRGYKRIGFVTGHNDERGHLFKAGFLMGQSNLEPSLRLPILILNDRDPWISKREMASWMKTQKPDAILTDVTQTRVMLQKIGYSVPDDVGLAAVSLLDGDVDTGIYQNSEEIGRVALLVVVSLIHDNDCGIPPICRQILIEGRWVNGESMPTK